MKIKIAVISDIHSNADSLGIVLKKLKNEKIDITIILGDILTYGCQPLEVLSMLDEYRSENEVIFIKGNHDQFYFDLQSGMSNSIYNLPKFVEESVNWTLNKISNIFLQDFFSWHNNYSIGELYFSHANLFPYGNWSYIESSENLHKTFQLLNDKNIFAGVFGHSHRQLFVGSKKNTLNEINSFYNQENKIDQLIINAGSIGQPRGKGIGYILLDLNNYKLEKADFEKVEINFRNSIDLIRQTKLSQLTKKKLIDYLEI